MKQYRGRIMEERTCFYEQVRSRKRKQPPEVFYRKGFLKDSQNSKAFSFIKKETLTQVFSCEFCEILKNTFFTEHVRTTASGEK